MGAERGHTEESPPSTGSSTLVLASDEHGVVSSAQPLAGWVTWAIFLNLSEAQFPHPFDGVSDTYSHDIGEKQVKLWTKGTSFGAEHTEATGGRVSPII